MLTKRLIACFDVVDGRVTKAQQFQDNIDVAPAAELAQRLYADQIDEIVFYDIMASAQNRPIDLDTVREVAEHVFVPFTVGGGIRDLDDMFTVLKAWAEKISVDSMAVRNPDIIRAGAEAFGTQCIVLSTQVKHVGPSASIPSGYEVFIDGARTATGMDAIEWVRRGADLGAGEIVVNSIDADGTAAGLTDGGASAAIISSILYSPRLARNVGVRELKTGLGERGVHLRPWVDDTP